MKTLLTALASSLCLLAGASAASAQSNMSQVTLFEDAHRGQWCVFAGAAPADKGKLGVIKTATLQYAGDRLSEIKLIEKDNSGLMVRDNYFVGRTGSIVRLSRHISMPANDASVSQIFSIAEGKAANPRTDAKRISTGAVLSADAFSSTLPVKTDVGMFPFAGFLTQAAQLQKGACVSAVTSRS